VAEHFKGQTPFLLLRQQHPS